MSAETPKEKTRLPVTSVPESEILDWYDCGWEYLGPSGDSNLCVMTWKSDRRPVAPFREDPEDKNLLNAVAALEGRAVA